jgi:hypothetical protein
LLSRDVHEHKRMSEHLDKAGFDSVVDVAGGKRLLEKKMRCE